MRKVTVDIPISLLIYLDSLTISKTMYKHLLKLIATFLYVLEEDDTISPYTYYKPFPTNYIQTITSKKFYEEVFLKMVYNLERDGDNENESDYLFHTDGSYKVGYYPLHYRLNPDYLFDETNEVEVELNLPEPELNVVFKELIEYYKWSFNKISLDQGRVDAAIDEELSIGFNTPKDEPDVCFVTRSYQEGVSLNDISMPSIHIYEANIDGRKRKINAGLNYLKSILNDYKKDDKTYSIIIDGDRVSIDNPNIYQTQREKRAKQSARRKIEKIKRDVAQYGFSDTNGRFYSNLTSLPSFLVKYLKVDGVGLASIDLKSSQLMILLNLMKRNDKLKESIKDSKLSKLKEYHGTFLTIDDSEYDIEGFFHECLDGDIYQSMADDLGITRDLAKPFFLRLLFTEPGYGLPKDAAFSNNFNSFFEYLKAIKTVFKKKYGSSKKSLSLFLQMLESHIFMELAYGKLAELMDFPAFTKHDSVLVPDKKIYRENALQVMHKIFRELGFKGELKVEESWVHSLPSGIDLNDPSMNLIFAYPELYKSQDSEDFA